VPQPASRERGGGGDDGGLLDFGANKHSLEQTADIYCPKYARNEAQGGAEAEQTACSAELRARTVRASTNAALRRCVSSIARGIFYSGAYEMLRRRAASYAVGCLY
jgi:hypothetical protein